ncbi:hypothetical protein Dsin_024282 [Dipteronia sinensis]|uniref:RNase H type-1 domain-containing protein n=1 Tax=Dipteronia sinensis TaxID=43782 RepID=A0AAD9ZU57_9ROSI|nr:hypothetical protein Dsin_024282 [Dipteronia sinensis]
MWDILNIVEYYFSDVFCSSNPSQSQMEVVFNCVQPCLSLSKCAFLDPKFPLDEILWAIFDMSLSKAPSLDGLPGKGLFEAGSRWRIGSGDSVCIYKDQWLPRSSTFRVISPPTPGSAALVRGLKTHSGRWNEPLVHQAFISNDANEGRFLLCLSLITPLGDRWRKACIKLIQTAEIDVYNRRVRTGAIIRDSNGQVMASYAQTITASYNLQIAESVAILTGIFFARDAGL